MTAFALGDRQFAYRLTGMILQNLGNTGGRSLSLAQYDYEKIGEWLFLADAFDPKSNFIPLLASFYFSATPNDEDLTPIIDYLATVGLRTDTQKWRWLAQAVYLTRFRQGDLEKALTLSQALAEHWREGRPAWMKQMPALILSSQGETEAAYNILMRTLKDEGDRMHPAEVKFMVDHICQKLLTPIQAAQHPLCGGNTVPTEGP